MDTGLEALKTVPKKVVHKAASSAGEFIGEKIADSVAKSKVDNIVKQKPVIDKNSRIAEEIVIPPEKRVNILFL